MLDDVHEPTARLAACIAMIQVTRVRDSLGGIPVQGSPLKGALMDGENELGLREPAVNDRPTGPPPAGKVAKAT